jgi:hypothetical protein
MLVWGSGRWGSARASAWAVALLALACLVATPADSATPQSAAASPAAPVTSELHPILIELFTSEGCSSCPPADALLEKLDVHQPIPGAQLIVLSEHVDYWDHDGWKDPNSSAQLTARQADYEHELGRDGPFTPQMIVDGTTDPRINVAADIENALVKAKDLPMIPMRLGDVTIDPGSLTLHAHVEADTNSDKHNADVFVAVALDHFQSQVLKGENGGKHLTHVAVVQEIKKVGKLPKGKSFAGEVELKLKPGTDPKNIRVVAFVQEAGPGKVLGTVERKPTS